MALEDIREGDLFIAGGVTYIVRAVAEWSQELGAMSGRFALRATVSFSTKRSPAAVSNKIGAQVTNLTGQYCLPIMPADSRILDRAGIKGDAMGGFGEIKVAYTEGLEILLYEDKTP